MFKKSTRYTERYYVFPAVLDDSENGKDMYTISFPDVPPAFSEGKGITKALVRGKQVLEGILIATDEPYTRSSLEKVKKDNPDKIVTYVVADMKEANEITKPSTVKKNTSIPRDLAIRGEKEGINFSKLLTDALNVKLG